MLAKDAHVFSLPLSFPAGFACLSSSHICIHGQPYPPRATTHRGLHPSWPTESKAPSPSPPLSRALLPPNTGSVTLQHDPRSYHQWIGKGEFQRFA